MNLDRTGWIAVIICSIGLMLWYSSSMKEAQKAREAAAIAAAAKKAALEANPEIEPTPEAADKATEPIPDPSEQEQLTSIETDGVIFNFTNLGGGIASTELLKHNQSLNSEEHVIFNRYEGAKARSPIGALGKGFGALGYGREFEDLPYSLTEKGEESVTYAATRPDGLSVQKSYKVHHEPDEIEGEDGHVVDLELRLTNSGDSPIALQQYSLYGGAAAALNARRGMWSGFYWQNAKKSHYKPVTWFNKFLFFKQEQEYVEHQTPQLKWGGVSNQFFASIIRPVEPIDSVYWSGRFPFTVVGQEEISKKMRVNGVECALGLPKQQLAPGETRVVNYEIYVGPKEYGRLARLPAEQKAIMGYDKIPVMGPILGWVIKPFAQLLNRILTYFGEKTGNYGIAIILLTIVVRLCMWPLHSKAHQTSKRMASLTPKLNELREKYPDDPQRMQQEQMKLWGQYGINPMGGCLPALLQIPIFIGYFRMLLSAVEVRHEPFFLWLNDLSMPDTLGYVWDWVPLIGGAPINLLPFLMTGTSYLQFALMPKTGDKTQRMMFMLFPLMFLVFCYRYPSALALYWTMQNIISIGQTWILNKRPAPELKKVKKSNKKTWFERLQEQAEAAQKAQAAQKKGQSAPAAAAGSSGGTTSNNFGEKGPRKQKPKSKSKQARSRSKGGKRKKRR